MIELRFGDALNVETGIIVHGCNCLGVMGAGIAKQIKERFPSAYEVYRYHHVNGGLELGDITSAEVAPMKFIVNANTQQGVGGKRAVSYDAIAEAFERINDFATLLRDERGIVLDIVFPAIGAGLGGGNWQIIEKIIDHSVNDAFNKILYVYDK